MLKRRDMLGLGGAALLAAALPRARANRPAVRSPRRLLVVFAAGGWDTSYALDPKEPPLVDVPAGAVQRFEGLDVFTHATRPNVTAFFERYAANTAIVRGIGVDAINHLECQRRMATGTREDTRPDIGAMVAHDLGNALPIPYLILGDVAFTGPYAVSSARAGTTNQIVDLLEPPVDKIAETEDALLRAYAHASADRARATRGANGYNRRRVDDFAEALDRGSKLAALRGRFGSRGAMLDLEAQIPLALDALQQDVSHAVMLTTLLFWDTHVDNRYQSDFHETTFAGLSHLVGELIRRPGRAAGTRMIDDTVVLVISELSRTPHFNRIGDDAGKDHWPVTTAMAIGAGVRGGHVFGATTPDVLSVPVELATGAPSATGIRPMYTHFTAGVLALCGADPTAHIEAPAYDAFAV